MPVRKLPPEPRTGQINKISHFKAKRLRWVRLSLLPSTLTRSKTMPFLGTWDLVDLCGKGCMARRANHARRQRPRKGQQLNLFLNESRRFFGGRLLLGRRKGRRPLSSTEAVHVVFRSSWARGENSLLKTYNKNPVIGIIRSVAHRYRVRIYRLAVASNHVHLILKFGSRDLYKAFIRVVTGRIANHVMKSNSFKGFVRMVLSAGGVAQLDEVQGKGQRFFQFRPFSRVLHWGRDFRTCCEYVTQNELEAIGFLEYRPRADRYATWFRNTMGSSA
ncbi:MAG: transposase [Bdellovibrionales bacterium]